MTARILLFLALSPTLAAQSTSWSMFHGNSRRDGRIAVAAPSKQPQLRWRAEIGGPIISSPILAPDGTIVLGSIYQMDLHPQHAIVAVNPDGTVRWRFPTGFRDDQTLSSPAIASDGTIYVGAQDGGFYALTSAGALRWKYQASKPVYQHPVLGADGTVYVGIDGRLTAFSADGSVLWQSAETDIASHGGPSIGLDGTLYAVAGVHGDSAKLYAFEPDGSLRWTYSFGNPYFRPLAPPAVGPDGTIFAYASVLHAIRPDGTNRWVRELSWGDIHYGSPAVAADGSVYYAGWTAIWKVTPNGSIAWEHRLEVENRLGSSYSAPLVDAKGNVIVGLGTGKRYDLDFERRVLALSPAGAELWHFDLPSIPSTSAPALSPDGTVYIGCFDGGLYAFE
jgi:outer membrane protein assembly factor BamB